MEIEEPKIPHQLNKRQILELAALIYPKVRDWYEYFSIDRVLFNTDGVESELTGHGLRQQGKIMVSERFTFDMKTLDKEYVHAVFDENYPLEDEDDGVPDDAFIDDPETLQVMEEVIEIYDDFVLSKIKRRKESLWK